MQKIEFIYLSSKFGQAQVIRKDGLTFKFFNLNPCSPEGFSQTLTYFMKRVSFGKVLGQNVYFLYINSTQHPNQWPYCQAFVNDSLTVCGEKTDTKWESDYFQLVDTSFWAIKMSSTYMIEKKFQQKMLKHPSEIQRLKYRSAGERNEILCAETLELIIYMTWDKSLLSLARLT